MQATAGTGKDAKKKTDGTGWIAEPSSEVAGSKRMFGAEKDGPDVPSQIPALASQIESCFERSWGGLLEGL